METREAFAMGEANRGKPQMVFDWIKAATIVVEREAQNAAAGLQGDWEWTGGPILKNGLPVPAADTYVYLASTWAIPELEVDGETMDCFIMEDKTEWNEHTYWPKEALDILKGGDDG
jgi:hypothetical protein